MQIKATLNFLLHRPGSYSGSSKFHPIIKIISSILIITFIFQDIVWAYPDKLAVQSFSRDKDSFAKATARGIVALVEEGRIPRENLTLEAIDGILRKHEREGWYSFETVRNNEQVIIEVRINVAGRSLRYFTKTRDSEEKIAISSGPAPVRVNARLFKQVVAEMAGPDEAAAALAAGLIPESLNSPDEDTKLTALAQVAGPAEPAIKMRLIALLEDPSERVRKGASEALTRIGEPPCWVDIVRQIREGEEGAKNGEALASLQKDKDWFHGKSRVYANMRRLMADPETCRASILARYLDNEFYLTNRMAGAVWNLREKGPVSQNRYTLFLKPGKDFRPPQSLPADWKYNPDMPLEAPWQFFRRSSGEEKVNDLTALEVGKAIDSALYEVATIAYSIEGDSVVINDFLVAHEYKGRLIASWLFTSVLSDILITRGVKKIRFNYTAKGAYEFLFAISQPSDAGLVIGPFKDAEGEYYLPGKRFRQLIPSLESLPAELLRRINPTAIMELSRDLALATDPNLSLDQAMGAIVNSLHRVSDYSGCSGLTVYRPVIDDACNARTRRIKGRDRYIWTCTSQRGMRLSRVENSPLSGEKEILEMMATGVIEPIAIPGVSEYDNGVWVIHDREALYQRLANDPTLGPIVAEARQALDADRSEAPSGYGREEGNAICYAYAMSEDKKPLYLFAAVGKLLPQQIAMIKTGKVEATYAEERIMLLQAMKRRYMQLSAVYEELCAIEAMEDGLRGFFHALGNDLATALGFWIQERSSEAMRAMSEDTKAVEARTSLKAHFDEIRNVAGELDKLRQALESTDEVSPIPGPREKGTTTSILDVFYQMLTASTTAQVKTRLEAYTTAEGADNKSLRLPHAALNRYHNAYQLYGGMVKAFDENYAAVERQYKDAREKMASIAHSYQLIWQSLRAWRDKNEELFVVLDRIRDDPAMPDKIKTNAEAFTKWLNIKGRMSVTVRIPVKQKDGTVVTEERRILLTKIRKKQLRNAFIIREYLGTVRTNALGARRVLGLDKPIALKADMIALLRDGVRIGKDRLKGRGAPVKEDAIREEYGAKDCRVLIDPPIFELAVISELIVNAEKYKRPDSGPIRVVLDVDERFGFARVSVIDNGEGIRHENWNRIFSKGFRAAETMNKIQGTGYGLFTAHNLMRELGSDIVLEDSLHIEEARRMGLPSSRAGTMVTCYVPLEERKTVWATDEENKFIGQRLLRLEHVADNLEQIMGADLNIRVPKFSKKGDLRGLKRKRLARLYKNIVKVRQMVERLHEAKEDGTLSYACFVDTLFRRIQPLYNTRTIRRVIGDLRRFYRLHDAPRYADVCDTYDEYCAIIENELFAMPGGAAGTTGPADLSPAGSPMQCAIAVNQYVELKANINAVFNAQRLINAGLRKKKGHMADLALSTVKRELRILHHIGIIEPVNSNRPYLYRVKSAIRNLSPPQRRAFARGVISLREINRPYLSPARRRAVKTKVDNILSQVSANAHVALPRTNIVPVVTPLTELGAIDHRTIRSYVAYLAAVGAEAIFVMGTAGEFNNLPNGKRLAAIRTFARAAKQYGIMVFANATGDTSSQTMGNIKRIEKYGVDAVVLKPLYYLNTNDDIVPHFNRIRTHLPIVLSNDPDMARGTDIEPKVLSGLKGRYCAVYDSSGDMFKRYIRIARVYQAYEHDLLLALHLGAKGTVSAMGNASIFPQMITRDLPRTRLKEIQHVISKLRPPLTEDVRMIPARIKYFLWCRAVLPKYGVAKGTPAITPEEMDRVDGALSYLKAVRFIPLLSPEFRAPSGSYLNLDEALPRDLLKHVDRALDRSEALFVEVGCGGGQISEWLNRNHYNVIGLDPDRDYLARAVTSAKHGGLNYVSFQSGKKGPATIMAKDVQSAIAQGKKEKRPFIGYAMIRGDGNIPLESGTADAVVLHRVNDIIIDPKVEERLMSEIARVLKPEGTLSIVCSVKMADRDSPLANNATMRRGELSPSILRLLRQSRRFTTRETNFIPDYMLDNSDPEVSYLPAVVITADPVAWQSFHWETKRYVPADFMVSHSYTPKDFLQAYEAGLIDVPFIARQTTEGYFRRMLERDFAIASCRTTSVYFRSYGVRQHVPYIKILAVKKTDKHDSSAAPENDILFYADTLSRLLYGEAMAVANIEAGAPKDLILYADDMLDRGAVCDMKATLQNMDGATIVIYARRPENGILLDKMIGRMSNELGVEISTVIVNRIALPASDTEADELKSLIIQARRKGLNNENLLGIIKGRTQDTGGVGVIVNDPRYKARLVSFQSEDGIYSFAQAVTKLVEARKSDEYFIELPPVGRKSDEIDRAFAEYLRSLETARNA